MKRCCYCTDDEAWKYGECFCLCHTAGHQDNPKREGLSVRYSRGDAGCRDSLGDVPVIFVIRPARGCVDTGRRQHRRPTFSPTVNGELP